MDRGRLIILSGPSGVGKGTVRDLFMDDPDLNLTYSISMTTRSKRVGEREGIDYFFVDRETFEQSIKEGELLEHAEFVGNYYGTPKSYVNEQLSLGKNVLLEIEVEGASQVMEKVDDALTIFLVPPSLKELERRIRNRRTESEEIVRERLNKAERELEVVTDYQYAVCNTTPDEAAEKIRQIILNHK